MAFTYSGDPSISQHDWLRFMLGDINEAQPILQDAEIDYIVDTYKHQKQQLAAGFRQCANMFAIKPTKRSLGPQSEDTSKRQEYYATMADKYEKELTYLGTPPLPNYSSEKVFDKGMMSNV